MKFVGIITVASVLAAIPAAAHAQADGVAAQDAVPAEGQIKEIVVTAQRRAESVQKTSLVVQAIGGEELARANVAKVEDLSRVANGVQIAHTGAGAQVFVRGVGDPSASAFLNSPGISPNIDGVNVGRPDALSAQFYDLERVEVLKGPQGTLYGRNASGGAINLISRQPKLGQTDGYLNAGFGNYNLLSLAGAVGAPVSDTVAVRVAFNATEHDGYLSDGSNDNRQLAVRAQILFAPSTGVKNLIRADFSHITGVGGGTAVRVLGNDNVPKFTGTSSALGQKLLLDAVLATGQPAPVAAIIANSFSSIGSLGSDIRTYGVSDELTAQFGDFTLTVLPSFRREENRARVFPGFAATSEFNSSLFTIETRLAYTTDKDKIVAGLYFYDEKTDGNQFISQGVFNKTNNFLSNDTRSYAAFAQGTHSLTETLRVLAGIRYTSDKRDLDGNVSGIIPFGGSKKFTAVTWKGGVEFDATPDNLLAFTASTGFKGGGLNATVGTFASFQPERLTAFELQSKNRFLDNRLQVNAEFFYWRYRDRQNNSVIPDPGLGGAPNLITFNTERATLKGVDLSVVAKPTNDDTLVFNGEYLDAKNDNFVTPAFTPTIVPGVSTGCAVGAPRADGTSLLNCSGFQVDHAPRWSLSGSWEHVFTLESGATVTVTPSIRWVDSRWGSTEFTPIERLPSYTIGNFDIGYTSPDQKWQLSAFIQNIGNTMAQFGGILGNFSPSYFATIVLPPRTFGARVSYKFGG